MLQPVDIEFQPFKEIDTAIRECADAATMERIRGIHNSSNVKTDSY